jgi:hypothetical protein
MTERNDSEEAIHCAGDTMTRTELVRAWLAFKELRRAGRIEAAVSDREMLRAVQAGWQLRFFGQRASYIQNMEASPYRFWRGYEFGVDIVVTDGSHTLLHPKKLPALLATDRGLVDDRKLFQETDVDRWAQEFSAERRLVVAAESPALRDAQARAQQPTYVTSPLVFRDPFAVYRISDGKVAIDRSVFGIKFGDRPEVLTQDVREIRPSGTIWGDVAFSNNSREVVVWKNVFRPEQVKRQAERIVRASQANVVDSRQTGVSSALRQERKCPYCAELVLLEAKLCKHCHQPIHPVAPPA